MKPLHRCIADLGCGCGDEAVATADGRDFQVEGGVFGVAAFVEKIRIGFFGGDDRDKDVGLRVVLAEVIA